MTHRKRIERKLVNLIGDYTADLLRAAAISDRQDSDAEVQEAAAIMLEDLKALVRP